MKPVEIGFEYESKRYKVAFTEFGFRCYVERPMTVWEGALVLVDVGIEPITYQQIVPSVNTVKACLGAIQGLPLAQKQLIAKRGIDRLVAVLTDDWVCNAQIRQALGVL